MGYCPMRYAIKLRQENIYFYLKEKIEDGKKIVYFWTDDIKYSGGGIVLLFPTKLIARLAMKHYKYSSGYGGVHSIVLWDTVQ